MADKALPFHAPAGVPIVGQPCAITSAYIPLNVNVTCLCLGGDGTPLVIVGSVAVTCPHCQKSYNAFQPPANIQMQIDLPKPQVPS